MANEPGSDKDLEWFELYNDSRGTESLDDFEIHIGSKVIEFENGIEMESNSHLVFCQRLTTYGDTTGLAEYWLDGSGEWGDSYEESLILEPIELGVSLNITNSSGKIELYNNNDILVSEFEWTSSGLDGYSWERFSPLSDVIEQSVDTNNKEFKLTNQPTLEASLVDIADEIAYNAHDIDDGLSSGILTFEILHREETLVKLVGEDFFNDIKNNEDQKRYALVRKIINLMATDLINETQRKINESSIKNLDDIKNSTDKVSSFSSEMNMHVKGIKDFLFNKLYLDPKLMAMSKTANTIITTIFENLFDNPELMPQRFQEMLLTEEKQIVIADYIAGMTDRYAEKKYSELM